MNLNKEFNAPEKKQENTVKAKTSGEPHNLRVVQSRRSNHLHSLKEIKAMEKEKGMTDRKLHLRLQVERVVSRRKEMPKLNQPLLKERQQNQCLSRTHLGVRHRPLRQLHHLHPKLRRQ